MSPRVLPLLRRLAMVSLVAGLSFWLAVTAFLWTQQEKLIFHPQPVPAEYRARLEKFRLNEVQFDRGRGVILRGYCLPRAGRPLLVYYGGNAEEVSWQLADLAEWTDCGLLLVNYRGYGDSGGEPGERELVDDALAALDETMRRNNMKENDIILMGRSLGSGVATQVAARRKVAGLVLVTPFDSVRAVAAGLYPLVPMGLILRHPFDSSAVAGNISCPVLILAARKDEVIPSAHAEALAKAFSAPPEFVLSETATHNEVHHAPEYRSRIRAFLDRCKPGG